MGLEDYREFTRPLPPGGLDGPGDFRRMMGVIVDNCQSRKFTHFFEAAAGAGKNGESRRAGGEIQPQLAADGYGGHGIGSAMHQEPHILNFGPAGNGPELVVGMALAIEPMITRGHERTKVLSDDWTVVSHDSSTGAHFEHTYTITPDGKIFVLTAEDGGKEQLARLGVEVSDLL